jgi:hypothetical protein
MADLSTMFNQLGPAGGSILAGVQMGNEANAAKSEQAMRQAQMDKILMETDQAKLMNPLALQAKQQEIESAKFKAAQEKDLHRIDTLGRALPDIKAAPDATKHAVMEQAFINAGLPLDPQTKQQLYSMDGKTLTKFLEDKYSFAITNSPAYRQAYDVAEMQRKSAEKIAGGHDAATKYAADARASVAAAKKQGTANIDEQVKTGKMSAEKGAVAYYGAAMVEADPTEKERLLRMAASYEQLAMNLKNAGAAGKVDVGAAANLPTQTITPALGTPPAATPAAGGHSFADVQKMYPNVGADQLRKAYKDKFGVDLK